MVYLLFQLVLKTFNMALAQIKVMIDLVAMSIAVIFDNCSGGNI